MSFVGLQIFLLCYPFVREWSLGFLLGLLESLGNILPVDDLPDGLDVISPHVLVLQVVCVLQNRHG